MPPRFHQRTCSSPRPSEPDLPTPLLVHRRSRNDSSLGELLASGLATSPNTAGITTRPIRTATKRTFYEASSSDPVYHSDDTDLSNILPEGTTNRPSRAWDTIPYESRRVAAAAKKKMEYIALMVNPWPNAADLENFLSRAWDESCQELGEEANRCITSSKCLKQSLSAIRGHLVRVAKSNVLELFPYLAQARSNTERRENTLHLLERDRFLVPDVYHGREEIGGYWRGEAISRLIYMHFFARERQRGNKDPEAFLQRMTSSFLCLIACALRHALTQFEETGERQRVSDFNELSQLAHWNRFAKYWTAHDATRAISWMGYIQNQVDKLLAPRGSDWDAVRQEPYALDEDIERTFDGIEIQPIRARERPHMVLPRNVTGATLHRGLPMQRPLFDTDDSGLSDPIDAPHPETAMANGPVALTTPLHTSEDPNAQEGPRKRSRAIVIDEEDDE